MAYKYSFADNETYGAEDLNKMVKRLVTSGVADPFADGVPYNLASLNSAGALIYTEGVVPESVSTLKVVLLGEGTAFINPGTAFFADGAVMEIEPGGHTLSVTPGVKNHVYLKNDLTASNTCCPACTAEEPTGLFVPLAEISENGEITDKRIYAKGKLPGYASNAQYVTEIHDSATLTSANGTTAEGQAVYKLGNQSYRFVLAMHKSTGGIKDHSCLGVYDIAAGTYLSFYETDYVNINCLTDTTALVIGCEYNNTRGLCTMQVLLTGGTLTCTIRADHSDEINEPGDTMSVSYDLYLF